MLNLWKRNEQVFEFVKGHRLAQIAAELMGVGLSTSDQTQHMWLSSCETVIAGNAILKQAEVAAFLIGGRCKAVC